MNPDGLCVHMAEGQCGLFSLPQAHAAGMNKDQIHRRSSAGRIVRVLPGVFSYAGVPDSWNRDLTAVRLWAGDESAASHRAAARILGFYGFSGAPIEIHDLLKEFDTLAPAERSAHRCPSRGPACVAGGHHRR